MTSKQYLRQAYRLNELINSHIKEKEMLYELSVSLSSQLSGDRVQGSTSDKVGKTVAKIVDFGNLIDEEIDSLVDLKAEIHSVIDKVAGNDTKLVLRKRYIEFFEWKDIADELNFTLQWVNVLHNRGLQQVSNIISSVDEN